MLRPNFYKQQEYSLRQEKLMSISQGDCWVRLLAIALLARFAY